MPFIPGRRRKKRPKARNSSRDSQEFMWLADSDEDDAFLTGNRRHEAAVASVDNGRKRNRSETNDNHSSSCSHLEGSGGNIMDRSVALVNMLHLREIGIVGQTSRQKSPSAKRMIDHHGRKMWKSMLLRKPSPPPSTACSENDSTDEFSDSQWTDYEPPIYNLQYIKNNNVPLNKQVWRKKQVIPFSQLKTPIMDAILGITSSGGYLIGIGGEDRARKSYAYKDGCRLKLLLKFFGVPSPDRLHQFQQNNTKKQLVSPLLHTVPLLFENSDANENRNLFGFGHYSSPAAETPVQILLSDNETIGVALIQHAAENGNEFLQDEDALGTIVIFDMPSIVKPNSRLTRSLHCSNIRIGGWNSFTARNFLWPTTITPVKSANHTKHNFLCNSIRKVLSGFVLFNDEDDGFRISWVATFGTMSPSCSFQNRPCSMQSSRTDILTVPEEDVWEMKVTNSETGQIHENPSSKGSSGLEVAFEVYLAVDALLSDILSRRSHSSLFGKSPYQSDSVNFFPDYCYNLISVSPDQLKVTLVIVFSNREKMLHTKKSMPSTMGVFVQLNLYDQSYDEMQWVCHNIQNNVSSMKKWCASLALNWRMKECGVGVFCTDSSLTESCDNWFGSTHEHNCDHDLDDDVNPQLWTQYAQKLPRPGMLPPKAISMSSLFRGCDIVSNRAVQSAVPLTRMTSRCSPIEVVYG